MSKSLRLSEKWFRRGLWLVALVFASFLIGLGGTVVGDLPKVERQLALEDFIDKAAADPLRAAETGAERAGQQAQRDLEQADLKLQVASQASRNARETFANWLSTRRATQQPEQDAELIARTRALDELKAKEDAEQQKVDAQRQIALNARQAQRQAQQRLGDLERDAGVKLQAEYRRVELRVFGYRLALTLPLLVVAGWLFARKRKSTWWNWCRISPAMAATCATSWALPLRCWSDAMPSWRSTATWRARRSPRRNPTRCAAKS
jgi:hypothetical protein